MHGYWFYTTKSGIFGVDGRKATKISPPDNLTQWIITQSIGYTRNAFEIINRSVRAYLHLVLTFQVQTSSSIVGNSASALDAEQVFKSMFKALINEDYSISADIDRYQGVLKHTLSKKYFSVGIGIYMLHTNLNLSIRKTVGYNDKILIKNTVMTIGSNMDIKKVYKKIYLKRT